MAVMLSILGRLTTIISVGTLIAAVGTDIFWSAQARWNKHRTKK